jgi:putative peptidoglycan lipid II flippase
VLFFTQVLNFFLVPVLQHAALTLTIAIGALVNATWLLVGLIRRGSYTPEPGWGKFALQVLAGTLVLAVLLVWGSRYFDWIGLRAQPLHRIGLLAALIAGAAVLYFAVLTAVGVRPRSFMRR